MIPQDFIWVLFSGFFFGLKEASFGVGFGSFKQKMYSRDICSITYQNLKVNNLFKLNERKVSILYTNVLVVVCKIQKSAQRHV